MCRWNLWAYLGNNVFRKVTVVTVIWAGKSGVQIPAGARDFLVPGLFLEAEAARARS
jgi:hypothetical protein